jgi:hypothetical protein
MEFSIISMFIGFVCSLGLYLIKKDNDKKISEIKQLRE